MAAVGLELAGDVAAGCARADLARAASGACKDWRLGRALGGIATDALGMTDFDKPVNIYVNTQLRYSSKVTPSLETMLADLAERGDRQRLVVACVKLTKP